MSESGIGVETDRTSWHSYSVLTRVIRLGVGRIASIKPGPTNKIPLSFQT